MSNLPAMKPRVREMASQLQQLGWEYVETGNHHNFEHPVYGKTTLPKTPSRDFDNAKRSEIASRMGISKQELELRLGLRQPKRQGPKVKRERNDAGRQARRFELVRGERDQQPVRRGSLKDRMDQVVRDLREAEGRYARAAHEQIGSPAYRCALDDIARCEGEFMQLEQLMKEAA